MNLPSKIGPYDIVRKITEGGMGEVFEAIDPKLSRRVAVKILTIKGAHEEEIKAKFLGEGQALGILNHPNVVRAYQLGEHEGRPFLAMEYIEGMTIDRYVHLHHPGLDEVLKLFRQIAEGLKAAHQAQILHRDIKPSNIMIDRMGQVKLVDFGIAKIGGGNANPQQQTKAGHMWGTPNYMAPEIFKGKPATVKSDIYSLGLIFYFLLTDDIPHFHQSEKSVMEIIDEGSSRVHIKLLRVLPNSLREMMAAMTHRSPELRYDSIDEILADLNKINLTEVHPDLITGASQSVEVKNLEEVYTHCAKLGLSEGEARAVINLATNILPARPPGEEKWIKIDEVQIKTALQRYQSALQETMARRVAEPTMQIQTEGPPPSRAPVITSWDFGRFAGWAAKLAVGVAISLAIHSLDKKKIEVWIEQKTSFAKARSANQDSPESRSLAAINSGLELKIRPIVPGESFTYAYKVFDQKGQIVHTQTRVWDVLSNKNGYVVWEDDNGAQELFGPSPFLPPIQAKKTPLRDQPRFDYDPKQVTSALTQSQPLNVKIRKSTGTEFERICTLASQETLQTELGKIPTKKVDCLDKDTSDREIFFYSEKLGVVVRRLKYENGHQKLLAELVGFSKKN
ncbi:MAG: serine/threonine protein kinase [Bdellovibrionales bacterium]